jgi:hypothetical protein
MSSADVRGGLIEVLRSMEETLENSPHKIVQARIRRVREELEAALPGPLSSDVVHHVHQLRQGTMGSLSDVVFADLRDNRWIPDEARNERWLQLSGELRDYAQRLL